MEVQDGFIVGIFNYCDRWCERCPLTGRCRVFATLAEIDFEEGNGPLTEPRSSRERRRIEMQGIAMHMAAEEAARLPSCHTPGERVGKLPPDMERCVGPDPGSGRQRRAAPQEDARAIAIGESDGQAGSRNGSLLRAARSREDGTGPLAGGERRAGRPAVRRQRLGKSRAARTRSDGAGLAHAGRDASTCRHWDVAPFLAEIARMQRNLNRAVPHARGFIRPGFDEPDDVKMLEAAEC